MNLCKYGCGLEGKFLMKSFYGRKRGETCCSENWTQCPINRNKVSKRVKHICDNRSTEQKQTMVNKRLLTLAKIDSKGVSGFTKNALAVAASRRQEDGTYRGIDKTISTKRQIVNSIGQDIYQQTAIKTAISRYGCYLGLEGKTDFEKYKYQVGKFTKQQPIHTLSNHQLRGGYDTSTNPWHLDHKFSIVYGFRNNIPAYIIGHISNLEMIPARKNNSKGSKCSVAKEALFEGFFSSLRTECLD